MSEFYKKFLLEDTRRLSPNASRQLFLAAFGKHPGWDDHISEDLGLETDSLLMVKNLLYLQGIGGQIDRGEWDKLDASLQVSGFKHIFIWQRGNQVIVGRMWSSSDGKGRTRYPMIVCAHCVGSSLALALHLVLPALEQLEQECLLTDQASNVRLAVSRQRTELRAVIAGLNTETIPAGLDTNDVLEFIQHPALGPDQEGWVRILYQMESQLTAFAPGRVNLKGNLSTLRPQQMRVPASTKSPGKAALLWSRFLAGQLDPAAPFLLTIPMEEDWLDITVGEPTPHEFYCLRANPKALPLASEVPYNIDVGFREKALESLQAFQRGEAPLGNAGAIAGSNGAKGKFWKWFGGS